ncbi:MAG TPA: substrate-binding domain-containing protein [Solirubrobacteraceae bacterium]|nr:substrate-binding domain-containing protein [Solirubrobacteraceae bacterium]
MSSARRLAALLIAVALSAGLLAACGSGSSSSASSSSKSASSSSSSVTTVQQVAATAGRPCHYRFAFISHGDNGSFWSIVYKGVRQAAADYGCTLTEVYGSQQQGQAEPDDNAENAQIQNAINQHVDGLIISDHDPTLMNPTMAKATADGIPVVTFNAGCDPADIAASHAITCVGQPETVAGQAAGAQFAHLGKNNVLCVIHQSGQNLLDRCNGIAQALGVGQTCKTGSPPAHGPACTEITLSTPNAASNPQQAIGQVTAYLQTHPQINAVMALNNAIGTALVGTHPKAIVATFDVNTEVADDIANGSLAFAIDQQPYLQGYLPVVILYLYLTHHQSVAGGQILPTGPFVIDKGNVANLQKAIANGED